MIVVTEHRNPSRYPGTKLPVAVDFANVGVVDDEVLEGTEGLIGVKIEEDVKATVPFPSEVVEVVGEEAGT